MLDFWYSPRCHRQIKLLLCISMCLIIYMTARIAELSLTFTLISLGLGALIHVSRMIKLKLQAKARYNTALDSLFFILPLMYWLILMLSLPSLHLWALMLQALSFMALGLFVVSIYMQRAPRFSDS